MRHVCSGSTIVAATLMLLSVDCASADLIIHSTSRSVSASYSFSPPTTPGVTVSESFGGLGEWENSVATDPFKALEGQTIEGSASQSSFISSSSITMTSDVSASAAPAGDASGLFEFINSMGTSSLNMTFSVGMPTPVEIIASWSGAGSGSWGVGAFPFILLEPVDQSNKIVLESLFGSGEANHNLLLQPGDYSLSVTDFASAGSETFSGLAVSEFSSSLNFEMTVIPAPGAVLLFSFAGLAARRRRTH